MSEPGAEGADPMVAPVAVVAFRVRMSSRYSVRLFEFTGLSGTVRTALPIISHDVIDRVGSAPFA